MAIDGNRCGSKRRPRMYEELAEWWHLLSDPADYAEEAASFVRLLRGASDPPARTVLELGSGGGNNAFHMKHHFTMTLSDVSPQMVAVSRSLNPDCTHEVGDMRTLRLGRTFDAVFVHDAIMYMTTVDDLSRAVATAYIHCRPGGAALFVPDHVRETFLPETRHGGHDGATRAMRYLEWTHDTGETDSTYTVSFAFLLREDDGSTRVEYDHHTVGLFPRAVWCDVIREAGFECTLDGSDPYNRDMFVAVRPRKAVEPR